MDLISELSLPLALKNVLQRLARPVREDYLDYFTTEIESFREELKTRDDYHELTDVALTEKILQAAHFLIQLYPYRSREEKRLILAALRYFIQDEEEDVDSEHPYAFERDAIVLNAVLNRLGMFDHQIPI